MSLLADPAIIDTTDHVAPPAALAVPPDLVPEPSTVHATLDDVLAAVGARQNYHLTSLNKPFDDNGVDLIDTIGDIDPRHAGVDDHLSMLPHLTRLPLRERRILTLRFYDHMTQTQIAAEIGMSQTHVSRLLRRSLAQLRNAMPGQRAHQTQAGPAAAADTDRSGLADTRPGRSGE